MKIAMSKAVAPVLLGLLLIAPSVLAQGPNDESNGVDSNDDIWIKDCMGREVPAALLENNFCDSFPLKNLVSYKSHDSSEANNEAHALGINLDCMKLAFDQGACSADSNASPSQPENDIELIVVQPTRDTFQIYLKSLRTIHGFDISFSALYQPELLSGSSEAPSSTWLASQPELSLSMISKGSAILLGPHTDRMDPELEVLSGSSDWFVSRQFDTSADPASTGADLFISPSSEMHLFMEMRLTANIGINFTSFEGTEVQEIEGSMELLGSVLSVCLDDMAFTDANGSPLSFNMISPNCWNPNQLNGHGSKIMDNFPDVTYFLFDYGEGDLYSAALPLVESLSLGLTQCDQGLTRDCRGICTPKKWLHDKVCHENFNCMELGYDGGDCLTSNTGSASPGETAKFHIETYQVSDVYKTAIYVQANEAFSGFSFRLVDEQGSANAFSISKIDLSKGLISAAGMTVTWDENQNIVSAFMKSVLQNSASQEPDESSGGADMATLYASCAGTIAGKPNMCLVMEIVLSPESDADASPSGPESNSSASDIGPSLISDSFTGTSSIANQSRARPMRACLESVQAFDAQGDPLSSTVRCSISERDGVVVTPILSTGVGSQINHAVIKENSVWEQGLHSYQGGVGAFHTTIEVLFDTDHIVEEIDFDFEFTAIVGDDVETVPAKVALIQNHGSSALNFVLVDAYNHVQARPKTADDLMLTSLKVSTTSSEGGINAALSGPPLFSKPLKPQVKFHILAPESIPAGSDMQLCIRQAHVAGIWNKDISVVQPSECVHLGEQLALTTNSVPSSPSPAQSPGQSSPQVPSEDTQQPTSEISIFLENIASFFTDDGQELHLVNVYATGDSQDIRGLEFNFESEGELVYGMGWNASHTSESAESTKFFELTTHSGNIAIAHHAPIDAPMLTCLSCPGNQIDFGHTMEEESISYQSSPLGSELVTFLKSNFYPVFIWPESPSQDVSSGSKPAQLVTSFLFEFNQTVYQDHDYPMSEVCITQANILSKAAIPYTVNYQTSSLCTSVIFSKSHTSDSDSDSSSATLSLAIILAIVFGAFLVASVALLVIYARIRGGSEADRAAGAQMGARIAPLGIIISPGRASNLPKRKTSMLVGEAAQYITPDGALPMCTDSGADADASTATIRSRCVSSMTKPRTYAPRVRIDV